MREEIEKPKTNNYIKVMGKEKQKPSEARAVRNVELFFFNDHVEWSAVNALEQAKNYAMQLHGKTGLETFQSVWRSTRFVALKAVGVAETFPSLIDPEGEPIG